MIMIQLTAEESSVLAHWLDHAAAWHAGREIRVIVDEHGLRLELGTCDTPGTNPLGIAVDR